MPSADRHPCAVSRRVLCAAGLSGALTSLLGGCHRAHPEPIRARLWFSYGGRNRETLERLLGRFVGSQDRYAIDGVFQGDYYEGLAKLRLALAAGAGPSMSHVIAEVVPYLAEAHVLEPLGAYPGAHEFDAWEGQSKREKWRLRK